MIIKGLQKTTLLDFPTKVACTVFTSGCNFRCPFCHNASLVLKQDNSDTVNIEAFFDYLKKRKGILDGVCITGGEPLLQKDIKEFISQIKELGYAVKLDTNGSNSKTLIELVNSKLVDYVAMDIKGSPDKYSLICGTDMERYMNDVCESVNFLLSRPCDYEFRTTVVRELHSNDDFNAIGKWISGANKYFLQQFKDSGDLIANNNFSAYNKEEMEELLAIVKNFVPNAELRGV